jgi:quercetin dioxygenase-like cupin family protein
VALSQIRDQAWAAWVPSTTISVPVNAQPGAPKGHAPYRRDEKARLAVVHAADTLEHKLALVPTPNWHPPSTEDNMQITRSSIDTAKGPADAFTGDVYIDTVAAPAGTSTFASALVHFTPGARTAWHTHPHGQTIFVTEGVGRCQREGGAIEVIRPGDRVFFEPGENHWHGAAPTRLMVHVATQQVDETGSPVTWGRQVNDEEYATAPNDGD